MINSRKTVGNVSGFEFRSNSVGEWIGLPYSNPGYTDSRKLNLSQAPLSIFDLQGFQVKNIGTLGRDCKTRNGQGMGRPKNEAGRFSWYCYNVLIMHANWSDQTSFPCRERCFFVLSRAWDKEQNSDSLWGIEPQTLGFRAPTLYYWATETLW